MAHERMLDGQGRKVVKQRVGDNREEHNIYRGMNESQANDFDHAWN
jgi:hypothetical protein